jgi:hypothetical protein
MTQRIDETARAVLLTLLSCGPRPEDDHGRVLLARAAYEQAVAMERVRESLVRAAAEFAESEAIRAAADEAVRPKWWAPIFGRIMHWVDGQPVA